MKRLILVMIFLFSVAMMTACCNDNHDETSMEVRGTLTLINQQAESKPPLNETAGVPGEGSNILTSTPTASPADLAVPAATAGTVMYRIDIIFTIISNLNIEATADEAGTQPFHTFYWSNVARGGEALTYSFWVHNRGEPVTFHSEITGDYLTITPPLNVTLDAGESRQFNMVLSVPMEAPVGEQNYVIEFIEGGFM